MTKQDVDGGPLQWRIEESFGTSRSNTQPLPQTRHSDRRQKWFRAASTKRWTTTIVLMLLALITVAVLLNLAAKNNGSMSRAQAFRVGFGAIDARLMINTSLPSRGASGLVAAVLLANCPQVICSCIYLAYNGLFTCMLLSDEWARYYLRPKLLRVTTPHGRQRSTYYL